jgi:hypothetical protein
LGLVKEARGSGQRREVIEPNLVVPLACKIKEVLSYVEKLVTSYFLANFFHHFSNNRCRRFFSNLDPAARQGPIVISGCSVNEKMACMNDYCGGTNLETLALEVNGNHDA